MKLHPESARLFEIDEAVEKAKGIAMRLLSARAYTRREIRDKLVQRGCSERAIGEAIQALERVALIDDVAFARRFASERLRLKPCGRPLLARDLKRRGVPESVVAEVLDTAFSETDPVASATGVLMQRAYRYRGLPREKALSRMYGFLGRRGFAASVAREAALAVWHTVQEDA